MILNKVIVELCWMARLVLNKKDAVAFLCIWWLVTSSNYDQQYRKPSVSVFLYLHIFPTPAQAQFLFFHNCRDFCYLGVFFSFFLKMMPFLFLSRYGRQIVKWLASQRPSTVQKCAIVAHTKPTCTHSQVKGRMDLRRMQCSSILLLEEKKKN